MKLYKYLPAKRLDIFSTHLLRFTPPAEFNDPFELFPAVKELLPESEVDPLIERLLALAGDNREEAERVYLEELAKHKPLFDLVGVDVARDLPLDLAMAQARAVGPTMMRAFIAQLTPLLRTTFPERIHDRLNTHFGILSLSATPDNLLMWAHYADAHRGFLLEFDITHVFFDRRTSPSDLLRHVEEVRYSRQRPMLTLYDPSAEPEEFISQLAASFFLTKSADWTYEREWRMILPLDDCPIRVPVSGLMPFPEPCVTGVVLGARMTDEAVARVVDDLAADRSWAHVDIQKARMHDEQFALALDHLDTLASGDCPI